MYAWWPDSLAKGVSLPSGLTEKRCYDAGGRLVSLVTAKGAVGDDCATSAPVVSRYDDSYDADGNRLAHLEARTDVVAGTLKPPEATAYGYDALDRLIGVSYPDGLSTLYQLDSTGNRTGERQLPTSKLTALTAAAFLAVLPADLLHDLSGVFNRADWLTSRSDAVTQVTTTLRYDANGNLVEKASPSGVRDFAWDCRDTLTSVEDDGVGVGSYDYDFKQQRVRRSAGAEAVEYVLDDKYVLQEADGSTPSRVSTRRYHYGYQQLAVSDSAGPRWLLNDELGSTGDETLAAGAVTKARQYDAWGQYRNGSAPTAQDAKLGFTGHQYDVETGLTYARARYYDAELGIFLSRDSKQGSPNDAPSLHRYLYVRDNPLRYVDPDGLTFLEWLLGTPAVNPAALDSCDANPSQCYSEERQAAENAQKAVENARRFNSAEPLSNTQAPIPEPPAPAPTVQRPPVVIGGTRK